MTPFADALSTLCLTQADAAELITNREGASMKLSMIADYARGKSRVPADVWEQLMRWWEAVESAADEIIADQGEADGGSMTLPITVEINGIDLPHDGLRRAAFVRARMVLGPKLLLEA